MPADLGDGPTQTGLALQRGEGRGEQREAEGSRGEQGLRLTYANGSAVWLLAALAAALLAARRGCLGALMAHGGGAHLGDCTQRADKAHAKVSSGNHAMFGGTVVQARV